MNDESGNQLRRLEHIRNAPTRKGRARLALRRASEKMLERLLDKLAAERLAKLEVAMARRKWETTYLKLLELEAGGGIEPPT